MRSTLWLKPRKEKAVNESTMERLVRAVGIRGRAHHRRLRGAGLCVRFTNAVGTAATANSQFGARPGVKNHCGTDYYYDWIYARVWRNGRRIPSLDPDRLRHIDCVWRIVLLHFIFQFQRGGSRVMTPVTKQDTWLVPV